MQADALAALLTHLDMTPAVIAGGSGGARVSLLTASRHPETAAGLAIWWISGGVYGLLSLATHYCGGSVGAAWNHGMEAVADLPEWAEVQELNPSNRERFLSQDRADVHRHAGALDAGLLPSRRRARARPPRRRRHARSTSRRWSSAAARATPTTPAPRRRRWPSSCPRARLVEPPWGDREWIERQERTGRGPVRPLAPVGPPASRVAGRRSRLTAFVGPPPGICALSSGGHRPFSPDGRDSPDAAPT